MNTVDKKYTLHQKQFDVKEVVKVSEISDKYGNLRYKVALNNLEYIDEYSNVKTCYQIQVINCFSAPENLILVQKPGFNEPIISNYEHALSIYLGYIKTYTALVSAETRDLQDISINGDKIGYQITCPKCCMTCKWVRTKPARHDYILGISNKLECYNPKNNQTDVHQMNVHMHTHIVSTMHPNVNMFGVCDNYELKKHEYKPVIGDSLNSIIDTKILNAIKNEVNTTVSNEIKTEIKTVVETIEQKIPETVISTIEKNPEQILDALDGTKDNSLLIDSGGADNVYGGGA